MKEVKKRLEENEIYFSIYNELKRTSNLTNISKKLNISKQNLNNYIRQLRDDGLILRKGRGHYEIVNRSKKTTKYGGNLPKDFIRGHAYIWNVKLPKEIKDWNKRVEVLRNKQINFKLVGALKDTPRIKVLGRKVWLCNSHLRIFDKPNTSYYGNNAIESKKKAFIALLEIVSALESKLGFILRPFDFEFRKEHYALIKNDLAIDQNKKGIIWRIKDEHGEWLLIDDSLEEGGELENVGEDAFKVNLPMQKWWNNQKETNFQVTPSFLMESLSKLTQIQIESQKQLLEYRKENRSHLALIKEYRKENIAWRKYIKKEVIKQIDTNQSKLGDFI